MGYGSFIVKEYFNNKVFLPLPITVYLLCSITTFTSCTFCIRVLTVVLGDVFVSVFLFGDGQNPPETTQVS